LIVVVEPEAPDLTARIDRARELATRRSGHDRTAGVRVRTRVRDDRLSVETNATAACGDQDTYAKAHVPIIRTGSERLNLLAGFRPALDAVRHDRDVRVTKLEGAPGARVGSVSTSV
jgi:hypothetical protein